MTVHVWRARDLLLLLLLLLTYVQGIYNHIPETNRLCRVYVLQLFYSYNLWSKHVMVFPTINLLHSCISTLRSTCAVPSTVDCCSSLTSRFPVLLFRYFLNDFEADTFAPFNTGVIFIFKLRMRSIYIVRSLCFRVFLTSFLVTFPSHEIATTLNLHVLFFYYHGLWCLVLLLLLLLLLLLSLSLSTQNRGPRIVD